MPDMRLFSYVWRGTLGRSVRTASGELVYYKLQYVCKDVIGIGKKGFSCYRSHNIGSQSNISKFLFSGQSDYWRS